MHALLTCKSTALTRPVLVVRADADGRIGSGHVMRSLALAQEWQRQGGEVIFLGRIGDSLLRQRLEAEGCRVETLPASHPDPRDQPASLAWLGEQAGQPGWLVADGYHFDGPYHQALRASGWSLLVIDDYAHLPVYHADILLNPNAYAGDLKYHTDADTLLLLGSRFTPLRREFTHPAGREQPPGDHPGRRILVTMGGADPDNAGGRVVEALLALNRDDLEVKIVIGPLNPHRPALVNQVAAARFRTELLAAVSDMAPLMGWADLAISAAGSTCWELAALGVPMVVTVLADNQERVAASLAAQGVGVNLGWHHAWEAKDAAAVIRELLADPARLRQMAENGHRLVDGRGSERVVRAMRLYHFTVRPATNDDRETVYQWANDPQTRAVSFRQGPIPWPEHCRWFAARLADPDHLFYIVVSPGGEPLGQIRFALDPAGQAVISVGLDRNCRGSGLGGRIIRQACEQAITARSLTRVQARIRPDNAPSIRAFAKAGFRRCEPTPAPDHQAMTMEYTREGATP